MKHVPGRFGALPALVALATTLSPVPAHAGWEVVRPLPDVSFINGNIGMAVGGSEAPYVSNFVIRTEDGGFTWTRTDLAYLPYNNGPVYAIAMTAPLTATAAGRFVFQQTADGGATWEAREMIDPGTGIPFSASSRRSLSRA